VGCSTFNNFAAQMTTHEYARILETYNIGPLLTQIFDLAFNRVIREFVTQQRQFPLRRDWQHNFRMVASLDRKRLGTKLPMKTELDLRRFAEDTPSLKGIPASGNIHLKHGSAIPNMFSAMHLYPINGAAHRVGKTDTAWSYRDSTWAQVIVGVDPDPAHKDKIINRTRHYWTELCPYSLAGAYVNFMMDEGEDGVRDLS
jgi:hypothetical protein